METDKKKLEKCKNALMQKCKIGELKRGKNETFKSWKLRGRYTEFLKNGDWKRENLEGRNWKNAKIESWKIEKLKGSKDGKLRSWKHHRNHSKFLKLLCS